MNIEQLDEIAAAAKAAAHGKRQLIKAHDAYRSKVKDGFNRKATTTYNAKCADIVENQVAPNEAFLKSALSGHKGAE